MRTCVLHKHEHGHRQERREACWLALYCTAFPLRLILEPWVSERAAPYEGPSQECDEYRASSSGAPLPWDLSSAGVQHPLTDGPAILSQRMELIQGETIFPAPTPPLLCRWWRDSALSAASHQQPHRASYHNFLQPGPCRAVTRSSVGN